MRSGAPPAVTVLSLILPVLAAMSPCPAASANVAIADYDGTVVFELCISSMNYVNGVLNLSLYDTGSDGIFRSGFDQ